jgi:hypothetical protein
MVCPDQPYRRRLRDKEKPPEQLGSRPAGKAIEEWAAEHELTAYLGSSIKSEADLDWSNEAEKQAFLGVLVENTQKVVELAARMRASLTPGGPADERIVKATEILSKVLLQDVESDTPEDGTPQRRSKKIHQGTSGDRICSVTDPEMRHGRKSAHHRFDGHKLALATDVDSQLIVAVEVMEGSAPDDQGSLELAQQGAANTRLELEAVLGDCAYGSGDNRERFAKAGVELLAKVPRRSNGDFFSKDAFAIDTEAMTCGCPAGEVTSELVRAGTDHNRAGETIQVLAFAFKGSVCAACPLRDMCFKAAPPGKPPKRGRQVRMNPHEATMQAAKAWQQTPDFDLFRKQRQVVEHRIARMTQLGVRQARYFGRHKTLFQVLMAATVANLTLVMGRTRGQGASGASLQGLQSLLSALLRALSPLHLPHGPCGDPATLWRTASCTGLQ